MKNCEIQDLIKYGQIAGSKGYTPGISGNMSVRDGENIIITSSGASNGFLEIEDFSVVDFEGNWVRGNKKPSSERFLHLEYYRQRADINCVLHFHSPHLTAFASAGLPLNNPISPEIIYCFGEIPLAEYAIPGSDELVEKTAKYFKDCDIVLMQNHGVVVVAKDVKTAYLQLELVEEYAKTIIFTNLLGGAKILPSSELEKIYLLRQK